MIMPRFWQCLAFSISALGLGMQRQHLSCLVLLVVVPATAQQTPRIEDVVGIVRAKERHLRSIRYRVTQELHQGPAYATLVGHSTGSRARVEAVEPIHYEYAWSNEKVYWWTRYVSTKSRVKGGALIDADSAGKADSIQVFDGRTETGLYGRVWLKGREYLQGDVSPASTASLPRKWTLLDYGYRLDSERIGQNLARNWRIVGWDNDHRGKKALVIARVQPGVALRAWLDPANGYLATQYMRQVTRKGKQVVLYKRLLSGSELDGVWVPVSGADETYIDGRLALRRTLQGEVVQLNNVPDSLFQALSFPPNTGVTDLIMGRYYVVQKDRANLVPWLFGGTIAGLGGLAYWLIVWRRQAQNKEPNVKRHA